MKQGLSWVQITRETMDEIRSETTEVGKQRTRTSGPESDGEMKGAVSQHVPAARQDDQGGAGAAASSGIDPEAALPEEHAHRSTTKIYISRPSGSRRNSKPHAHVFAGKSHADRCYHRYLAELARTRPRQHPYYGATRTRWPDRQAGRLRTPRGPVVGEFDGPTDHQVPDAAPLPVLGYDYLIERRISSL
ncbi:hypothetical protein [Nocardia nepalensis]|uniref:hypothetical protein n=1 Tax=Nocardia nepalensis TaxID=3375448 RepID=UPI003B670C57